MIPQRGPFGVGKFKQYRDWTPYFKMFRSRVFFYIILQIFDLQNDGFIMLTMCFWHRAFQIQIPFHGDKITKRGSWRFPKHKPLLSISEPKHNGQQSNISNTCQ